MEFQQWRNYVPQQQFQQPSEEDRILCRSLLKLLLEQKNNRQEYSMGKEAWFDFCSSILGHQYSEESATQFLTRFPHIFAFTDLLNDGEVLVKPNLALALCKEHLSKDGCHNTHCSDLHCCKFYLHDTCKFRDNCSFGHDLKSGRNKAILDRYTLSLNWPETNGISSDFQATPKKFSSAPGTGRNMPEITISDLVQLLRQENPRVCKFYNSEAGCKHGTDGRKCPALHLCRMYVKYGQCGDGYCQLCHDIRSPQPFSLLTRYGYDVTKANEQSILRQLQREEVAPAAGMTPVKRGSPPAEQAQQDPYLQNPYHQSGYGGHLELQDDPYSRGYYGGALDFYESDDAAWSSQESRYCSEYPSNVGFYAEYPSDCEGVVPDRSQVVSSYAPVKGQMVALDLSQQGQYHQQFVYQVPSTKHQQQQQLLQQLHQQQQQQQAKAKEGGLKVCQYYNHKGCRYGDVELGNDDGRLRSGTEEGGCQNLHLCGHFVNGACVFSFETGKCKKSHDLHKEHNRTILERHDIDLSSGDEKAILAAIRYKISQQVVEMGDGSPSSSSSMERLSLDDLDPIEVRESVLKQAKKVAEDISSLKHEKIKTFVFLDLEATGLEQPRITELSLVCVYREDLEESEKQFNNPVNVGRSKHDYQPRVVNKLTLCVHPRKNIEETASAMTGLTMLSLMHQKDFDHGMVNLLFEFLDRLPRPACLVAHNGMRFDFPLLQAELNSIGRHGDLPRDLLCLDSLVMFRSLDESLRHAQSLPDSGASGQTSAARQPEPQANTKMPKRIAATQEQRTDWWGLSDDEGEAPTTPKPKVEVPDERTNVEKKSYRLAEVHRRATGRHPEETHRAEDDALALIRCFIFTPGSLRWADENAIQLSGVTPLVLPKRKPFEAGVFPKLSQ